MTCRINQKPFTMKRILFVIFSVLLLSAPVQNSMASLVCAPQNTQQTDLKQDQPNATPLAKVEPSAGQKAINVILAVVILIAFFGGLAYMFIILRKKLYVEVSVEQMKDQRLSQGLAPAASNDENSKAAELLETALNQWSSFKGEDGETYFIPRRMAHVRRSVALINQTKSFMPTDSTVIDRMNELGGIINERTKRSFAGSWTLLVVSALVLLLFFFIGPSGGFFKKVLSLWWLWGSMIFYIMASYAPQFLIEKRMEWFGGKKFSSGLIKTVLAIVAATPVSYTVVTKWNDGSTTKSEEGTGGFFLVVALALIALVIIGTCIILFGIINFLRNYLLYF